LALPVGLTWPLFLEAGLSFAAVWTRIDREREASLLHKHTNAVVGPASGIPIMPRVLKRAMYVVFGWVRGMER
jgi:hypothetical protein